MGTFLDLSLDVKLNYNQFVLSQSVCFEMAVDAISITIFENVNTALKLR